jgi:hypothetical protein
LYFNQEIDSCSSYHSHLPASRHTDTLWHRYPVCWNGWSLGIRVDLEGDYDGLCNGWWRFSPFAQTNNGFTSSGILSGMQITMGSCSFFFFDRYVRIFFICWYHIFLGFFWFLKFHGNVLCSCCRFLFFLGNLAVLQLYFMICT